MARLHINPCHRDWLHEQGLVTSEDFLRLSGVILCGHPDRHVARVTLTRDGREVCCYLKKEHRVPRRDRLANAWAGFGFVSKSWREMLVLQGAARAGIGCPEVLAAGEAAGQAFLLVAEIAGAIDLRAYLTQKRSTPARELGAALARLHDAGVDYPDLYAKHVLVVPGRDGDGVSFSLVDWQRARLTSRSRQPWHALAKLDATLPADLVARGERLRCLHAYLRSSGRATRLAEAARTIDRISRRLQQRRQVREMRQAGVPAGRQELLWLDGEALCVTREFHEELQGQIPGWLPLPRVSPRARNQVDRTVITQDAGRPLQLVRRWASRPLSWLTALLRGRSLRSPELDQAATIFRLQRFGVNVPRLLAVGQRCDAPWRTASFLLTELPRSTMPLARWLAENGQASRRRQQVVRQSGHAYRLIHQAGYFFDTDADTLADLLLVQPEPLSVCVGSVEGLRRRFPLSPWRMQADLANLFTALGPICSRSDQLRFLLSYLEAPRFTHNVRTWIRRFLLPRIDQAHRGGDFVAPRPVMKGALSS